MHSSIIFLPALLATALASPQSSTSLPLGSTCTFSSECANGASCYAVNSMLVTVCGNQGAGCTSDSQCAFNICVSGSCSGVLPCSSISIDYSTTATSAISTAAALALGTACTSSSQCANGASCYAVNSMETTVCGNQGASCTSDSQCAFNTCISGSCNGFLLTSSSSVTPASQTSASSSTTGTHSSIITSTVKPASNTTFTSTGVPVGFTTSGTVINRVTSSILVNSAGATTSFGAVATSITTAKPSSGAVKLGVRFGSAGNLAVAGLIVLLL